MFGSIVNSYDGMHGVANLASALHLAGSWAAYELGDIETKINTGCNRVQPTSPGSRSLVSSACPVDSMAYSCGTSTAPTQQPQVFTLASTYPGATSFLHDVGVIFATYGILS